MKECKQYNALPSRIIQVKRQRGNLRFVDNRSCNNVSLQFARVDVRGVGKFETTQFDEKKKSYCCGLRSYIKGVDMNLTFTPTAVVGGIPEKIGFIQIVHRMDPGEVKPVHRLRMDSNGNFLDRARPYTNPLYGTKNLVAGQTLDNSTPVSGAVSVGAVPITLTTLGDTTTLTPATMIDTPRSCRGMMFQTSAVGLVSKHYYGTVKWGFDRSHSYDILPGDTAAVVTSVNKWNSVGRAEGGLVLNSSYRKGFHSYPAGSVITDVTFGSTYIRGKIGGTALSHIPFTKVNDDSSGTSVTPF